MTEIPPEILKQIKKAAAEAWPGDREMQQEFVKDEVSSYRAAVTFDFGAAEAVRQQIIDLAEEHCGSWEERGDYYKEQATAYSQLKALDFSDLSSDYVIDLLGRAEDECGGYFDQQIDFIRNRIARFHEVNRIRAEIAPIRNVILRIESIIGNECCSGNIQNYGPFGEWQGEGRSFRYPVTFIRAGKEDKRHGRFNELAEEELLTGRYKFGANELSIFRALVKIVKMLEDEYGRKIPSK
jgi:hypothetical protein